MFWISFSPAPLNPVAGFLLVRPTLPNLKPATTTKERDELLHGIDVEETEARPRPHKPAAAATSPFDISGRDTP
jgi:hypothetical protein